MFGFEGGGGECGGGGGECGGGGDGGVGGAGDAGVGVGDFGVTGDVWAGGTMYFASGHFADPNVYGYDPQNCGKDEERSIGNKSSGFCCVVISVLMIVVITIAIVNNKKLKYLIHGS